MKYTIIKTREQYHAYCNKLEELAVSGSADEDILDEIDLITLLIEKWDEENTNFKAMDPVILLQSLMKDHSLKSKDLADILHVSPSVVSEILHYRKAFSKQVIRGLAEHFKLREEAFSKPYKMIGPIKKPTKKAVS